MTFRVRVLAVAGLVFAVLVAWAVSRPRFVSVVVRNGSRNPVAALRLVHESGVETGGGLRPGDEQTFRFEPGGETSFTLHVQYADGSRDSSAGEYAEAGYRFVETITDSGIASDVQLPRY